MSARCDHRFSWVGYDEDSCGDPADETCAECERDFCLDHVGKSDDGRWLCVGCAR